MWTDIKLYFLIQHSMYSFCTNSHLLGGAWICRRSHTVLMYRTISLSPSLWYKALHPSVGLECSGTLIFHLRHSNHISGTLISLHWLRVLEQIQDCSVDMWSSPWQQTVVPAGSIHPYHPCTWSVSCPFWWHETSSCASYRQSTISRQFFSGFHHVYIKFSAWPSYFINCRHFSIIWIFLFQHCFCIRTSMDLTVILFTHTTIKQPDCLIDFHWSCTFLTLCE